MIYPWLMLKFTAYLVAVGFGVMVVLISVLKVSQSELVVRVGAEDLIQESSESAIPDAEIMPIAEPIPIAMPVAEGGGSTDYYLPYPGLLPDHPLYFAKVIRDRVMLMLAANDSERLRLLQLYADKRIGASEFLVDGGKKELAEQTALKAEQYLKQAYDLAVKENEESALELVLAAGEKHLEILEKLQSEIGSERTMLLEAVELNRIVRESGR